MKNKGEVITRLCSKLPWILWGNGGKCYDEHKKQIKQSSKQSINELIINLAGFAIREAQELPFHS